MPLYQDSSNSTDITSQSLDPEQNNTDDNNPDLRQTMVYFTSKYVTTTIILDVLCFFLIIILTISAKRAYRYMLEKDRVLLLHFIFLETSLISKAITLSMCAYYYAMLQDKSLIQNFWIGFFIFAENFYYINFFIACSLNLSKWSLLLARVDYYAHTLNEQQFLRCKKNQNLVLKLTLSVMSIAELVLTFLNASIMDDNKARKIDSTLNLLYVINSFCLGVAFIVIGITLLRKLNFHYEDIYQEKKKEIRFGMLTVSLSLIMISLRLLFQEIYFGDFKRFKQDSLQKDFWGFPLYSFFVVFVFEFVPVISQIFLIIRSVKRNILEFGNKGTPNIYQIRIDQSPLSARNQARIDQIGLASEDNKQSSTSQSMPEDFPISHTGQFGDNVLIGSRENYLSSGFAFNHNQIFQMDQKKLSLYGNNVIHSSDQDKDSGCGMGSDEIYKLSGVSSSLNPDSI